LAHFGRRRRSGYRDFRFALPDVVADSASSGAFVVELASAPPQVLDLSLEACLIELDGTAMDSATGAAVQGHPRAGPCACVNTLAERDLAVEAGWLS